VNLNRAISHYQLAIWQKNGDIPTQMFPEHPNQAVIERLQMWNTQAQEQAETDSIHAGRGKDAEDRRGGTGWN
jgi:hypothetical protein